MQSACIFCQIVSNSASASIVYRDERVTAFRDIHPVGPTHILIAPNMHLESLNALHAEHAQDEALIGYMVSIARKLAAQENVDQGGYRLVINTGPDGGQTVHHLHLHLIGGRRMHWPPG